MSGRPALVMNTSHVVTWLFGKFTGGRDRLRERLHMWGETEAKTRRVGQWAVPDLTRSIVALTRGGEPLGRLKKIDAGPPLEKEN